MNTMNMIKKTLISTLILSAICAALLLYFIFRTESGFHKETEVYSIETFEYNKGWGYQISKNGKIIIYQSCIPCIDGQKSFPDKKSAISTGNLVLSKIKNYENPTVTMEELNAILKLNN